MIRGKLSQCIRNKCYLVGFCFQHQFNKLLFCAIAFNIKFSGDDLFNFPNIIVADMSFIGAGMNSYTIGPESLHIHSGFYYIRIIATS